MKNLKQKSRRGSRAEGVTKYHNCRFCYSDRLTQIIDFGTVPLAGGFLPKSSSKALKNEKLYPLEIGFCPDCFLVQVTTIIPAKTLYHGYYYFSSAINTLNKYFQDFTKELKKTFKPPNQHLIVEIGCNDGVLLKPLCQAGFNTVGVDPATNVVKPLAKQGFNVVNDFFNQKVAQKIKKKFGPADVIVSFHSFAHIDDMHQVVRGIKSLLKPDGTFIFEVHYLGTLLKQMQHDMIYHEHMSYYSMIALNEFFEYFGMEIFDVSAIPIRGGSMRFYVQNKKSATRKVTPRAKKLKKSELDHGLNRLKTYQDFYRAIDTTRKELMALLKKLKAKNQKIIGYGASGRATALMSFCGITKDHLDYFVDDAPAKQKALTPGNHLPIKSPQILDYPRSRPDYAVLFAWPFAKEIIQKKQRFLKNGGKFITPLPKVKIISQSHS